MENDVEDWFSQLPKDQCEVALELRRLVLAEGPHLSEEIKWGQPCYSGNAMVCYIQKAKTHLSLGFGKGARLPDPDGVLEGGGAQMRHAKIVSLNELDHDQLTALVKVAIALDQAN